MGAINQVTVASMTTDPKKTGASKPRPLSTPLQQGTAEQHKARRSLSGARSKYCFC